MLPSGVSTFSLVTLLSVLAAGLACRTGPPAEIEFASEVATVDGLRPVQGTRVHTIYLKPGARLGEYSEILVDPFMISYKRFVGSESSRRRKRAYVLAAATEERLRQTLRELFIEELGESRFFRISDVRGPQVLRVQCRVADLVVRRVRGGGAGDLQEIHVGEMTLILDVRDSETAEALARVGSRFESRAGQTIGLSADASWDRVEHEVRRWAIRLRESLDALYELDAAASAPRDLGGAP